MLSILLSVLITGFDENDLIGAGPIYMSYSKQPDDTHELTALLLIILYNNNNSTMLYPTGIM